MKNAFSILLQDIKSRGWRVPTVAGLAVVSMIGIMPELQHALPEAALTVAGIGAFLTAGYIINSDESRTMRSPKPIVYGTVVMGTIWLFVAVETAQRYIRNVNDKHEWLMVAASTLLCLAFLATGFVTGNIGRRRSHVKGIPNKELFK